MSEYDQQILDFSGAIIKLINNQLKAKCFTTDQIIRVSELLNVKIVQCIYSETSLINVVMNLNDKNEFFNKALEISTNIIFEADKILKITDEIIINVLNRAFNLQCPIQSFTPNEIKYIDEYDEDLYSLNTTTETSNQVQQSAGPAPPAEPYPFQNEDHQSFNSGPEQQQEEQQEQQEEETQMEQDKKFLELIKQQYFEKKQQMWETCLAEIYKQKTILEILLEQDKKEEKKNSIYYIKNHLNYIDWKLKLYFVYSHLT